ncbi:hypothetical protein J4G37_26340 [Microvirga sp. 3-52]|nr:hypothetical protein [Microvirga sp. 3-52]
METNPAPIGRTGPSLHPAAIVLLSGTGCYCLAVCVGVEVRAGESPLPGTPLTPSGFKAGVAGLSMVHLRFSRERPALSVEVAGQGPEWQGCRRSWLPSLPALESLVPTIRKAWSVHTTWCPGVSCNNLPER